MVKWSPKNIKLNKAQQTHRCNPCCTTTTTAVSRSSSRLPHLLLVFFFFACTTECAVDDQDKGVCGEARRPPQLPQNRCDVAVRNASTLTLAAFERLRGEPLLIRGAATHWPAQHRWTRSWLIEQLHNLPTLEPRRIEDQPVPPEVCCHNACRNQSHWIG